MREIAPRLGLEKEIQPLKWRQKGMRDRLALSKIEREKEMKFLLKYSETLIPIRCQNGIFAAKIHFDQYIKVLANPVGRNLLNDGFFIHIYRENLLKQAISRNFAYISGRWGVDGAVTTAPMSRSDLMHV